MSIYTPEYLTPAREDPFERRRREKREEEAKRQKEAAKQQKHQAQVQARRQAHQQQRSEEWSNWFHDELAGATELHDAIGQVLAEQIVKVRDELKSKIATLEDRIIELENKLTLSKRFDDLERNFAARQVALDEAKKGKPGRDGARGERGERGARGEKGDQGKDGIVPQIVSQKIEGYNFIVLRGDKLEIFDLRPMFENYHADAARE